MSDIHPIIGLLEGQKAVDRYSLIEQTFPIAKNAKISNALNDLACAPFTSFTVTPTYAYFGTAKDETSFGRLREPKLDKILKIAMKNQSKFGRGEKTVLDLNYRNGFEIEAKDLDTSLLSIIEGAIQKVLKGTLFVGKGRWPTLKPYKLAVYQQGGHFDWHRDTTHGDNHHGTVLIALNTSWKGGELSLRHRGVESTFDMQPTKMKGDPGRDELQISVVAFYTDVEHKVNPVTEGVRIILQYDVYLPEVSSDDTKGGADVDDDEDVCDDYDFYGPYENVTTAPLQEESKFELPDNGTENANALDRLVQALENQLANPRTTEVGFPLRHLYRQQSILPQYLKGVDALIYQRLSEDSSPFNVSLCPIILSATTDYETRSYSGCDSFSVVTKCLDSASDSQSESGHKSGSDSDQKVRYKFYLYDAIDIREISKTYYDEHSGNDAQEESCKYFGGGIFLRSKAVTGKRVYDGPSPLSGGKKAK